MQRFLRIAPTMLFLTAGCTFDAHGGGGAPSTGSDEASSTGPGFTTSSGIASASSATTTTGVTSTASASSSSSGSGGAPPLEPCGIPADDFQGFPTNWMPGSMTPFGTTDKGAHAPGDTLAELVIPGNFDDCYMTIAVETAPNAGSVLLELVKNDDSDNANITYQLSSQTLTCSSPACMATAEPTPAALGIVLTGGQIWFLRRAENTWKEVGHEDRLAWMTDGMPDKIRFGTSMGSNGADFDDFNVIPIAQSDLR